MAMPCDGTVYVVTSSYVSAEKINLDGLIQGNIEDVNKDKKHNLNVSEILLGDFESDSAEVTISQIVSSFSDGDVGLYIFDKKNLDYFMGYDAFMPLENILAQDVIDARGAYKKDGKTYAVSLEKSEFYKDYKFVTNDLYAAVIFERPDEEMDEDTKKFVSNSKVLLNELLK